MNPIHPVSRQQTIGALALALTALAYLAWAATFIDGSTFVALNGQRAYSLFDDAMISMRYAWHLTQGHGLVWNPGEYVQGFTNLLQTLLMAAAIALFGKLKAVLAIQILGAAVLLATAALAARLVFMHGGRRLPVAALVFLACLAYYPLNYWTLLGMETGLVALFLIAGYGFAARFGERGEVRDALALSLCIGLGYLTRPDSLAFGAPLLVLAGLARRPPTRRSAGALLAPVAALVVGGLLFQRLYYGEWLPNTYTLKVEGFPLGVRWSTGLEFILPYLTEHAPWLLAVVFAAIRLRRPLAWAGLATVGLALLYQIHVGGDAWSYWRMLAPIWPVGCVVLGLGLARWLETSAARGGWLTGALALVALPLLLLPPQWRFRDEITFRIAPDQVPDNQINVNRALLLDQLLAPRATVALFWAGTTAYYLDRRAIDLLGKCDRAIARLPPDLAGPQGKRPGHNKFDLNAVVRERTPTYVERLTWNGRDLSPLEAMRYREIRGRDMIPFYFRAGSPDVNWRLLGG